MQPCLLNESEFSVMRFLAMFPAIGAIIIALLALPFMAVRGFAMTNATLDKMPAAAREEVFKASPDARAQWDADQSARRVSDVIGTLNDAMATAIKTKVLTSDDAAFVGYNADKLPDGAFYLKTRQTGSDERQTVTDADLKRAGVTAFTSGSKSIKPTTKSLLDAVGVDHYFNGIKHQTGGKRVDDAKLCDGKCNSRDASKPHAHGDQSQRQIVASVGKLDKWMATFSDKNKKPIAASALIADLQHPSDSR